MSTLRTNNITDLTGGSANLNVPGTAKAWVSFNGTGTTSANQTIRASLNVSSVYKNGTGDYTVNFTAALADTNYAMVATVSGAGTQTVVGVDGIASPIKTVSSVRALFVRSSAYSSYPALDAATVDVAIFR